MAQLLYSFEGRNYHAYIIGVPKNLIRQVISTTQQALSENDLGSREVFKGRGWRVGLAIKIRGGIFPAK